MAAAAKYQDVLGRGVYSRRDAARLLGVKLRTLNRWIHGYRYTSSDSREGHVEPILEPSYGAALGRDDALSFRDLIELLFVVGFREEGLPLQYIRRAAEIAADKYRTDHPFSLKQFSTDGKRIFASIAKEEPEAARHLEDVVTGQFLFQRIVDRYLRQLEHSVETGETVRWWPLGRKRPIAVDPARSFGEPIDFPTGVPSAALYKAYVAEGSDSGAIIRVSKWFDVPPASIEAAVDFEEHLQAQA